MRFIADLHVHSRFARACSPALTLENIDAWCRVKGVDIVSTGDFTHPRWFEEIKSKLVPASEIYRGSTSGDASEVEPRGLYVLKTGLTPTSPPPIPLPQKPTLFMVGTEIACIYSQGPPKFPDGNFSRAGAKKVRRVHHCIYAPSLEVAGKVNAALTARGCKLGSDGRAIIGMSSKELLKIILAIDLRNVMIPAHAWTPWFAIFGSNSGFDSIEECFEELTPHIFAIETGLSSDPPMNWRVRELDRVALVSSSDAHSLPNLGREANVLEGNAKDLNYDNIMEAIKGASPVSLAAHNPPHPSLTLREEDRSAPPLKIRGGRGSYDNFHMLGTIEFIPDEGRYHFDGHRACKVRLHPAETKKLGGICPKCKKQVTVGVLSRVEELANEPAGRMPASRPQFWGLVELDKILAETLGVKGRAAKSVDNLYWSLVENFSSELYLLLNASLDSIAEKSGVRVAEAIKRVREGQVKIEPGYDGEYGVVHIFSDEEKKEARQRPLF